MVEFTSAQLFGWVSAFLWPLTRILGVMASAPLLSHKSIPVRVKLGLGLLLAMLVAPRRRRFRNRTRFPGPAFWSLPSKC